MWCMLAAIHPYPYQEMGNCDANRTTYYRQFEQEVKDDGIEWPIRLQQIPKLEKMNGWVLNKSGSINITAINEALI